MTVDHTHVRDPGDDLVELGRKVVNCERHGSVWCSCKVRQYLRMLASRGVLRETDSEPVAAPVDRGDLVTRLRRWRNVASAVDAHEAADEIERLQADRARRIAAHAEDAQAVFELTAENERLRAALSLTVAALDDILRRAWIDCHPGRPAKAMLNPADLSSWESWQTTLAETREVLGNE